MGSNKTFGTLLLLCLFCASSLAFVLRKRPRIRDNDNRLADALKVIEQLQQEQEEKAAMSQRYRQPYFWAGDVNGDQDDEDSDVVDDELLSRLLAGTEDSVEDDDDSPDEEEIAQEVLEPEKKRSGSTEADMQELQGILEPSEDERKKSVDKKEVKKNVPYALGGPALDKKGGKREYDPSSPMDKKNSFGKPEEKALAAEEVEKLLEDAGDDDDEDDDEEIEDEDFPMIPAEEVDLSEAPVKDWPTYPAKEVNINKEWWLNQYLGGLGTDSSSIKRKRSERKRPAQQPVGGDDSITSAREYIKQFLELEDDENTNLANALNLATLAQVEKSDKYIPAEVEFLRKAISDEEKLEGIKEAVDEEEEEGDGDEDTLVRKRTDPNEEDIPEIADEDPGLDEPVVNVDDDDDDDLTEEDLMVLRPYLQKMLQQYMMRAGVYQPSAEDSENELSYQDSLGKWYNRPIGLKDEGMSDKEWQMNPFLRDLYEKYRAGELSQNEGVYEPEEELEEDPDEDISEETEEEIEDALASYLDNETPQYAEEDTYASAGECPALELTDNCAFAREMNLHLDAEAEDLCNRHQLCYMCGSTHGLTSEDCDNGYLDEANRLCQTEGDECKDDAAGLYLIMLKGHEFHPAGELGPVCESTCTLDYVLGLDRK